MADRRIFQLTEITDKTNQWFILDSSANAEARRFDANNILSVSDGDARYAPLTALSDYYTKIESDARFVSLTLSQTVQGQKSFSDPCAFTNGLGIIGTLTIQGSNQSIYVTGSDLIFEDANAGPQTLSDLVGGGGVSQWLDDANGITYQAGNVGIGLASNASWALDVSGGLSITNTAGSRTILAYTLNNTGPGGILRLQNTSTGMQAGSEAGRIEFWKADGSTEGAGVVGRIRSEALDSGGTFTLIFETGQDVETPGGNNAKLSLNFLGELKLDPMSVARDVRIDFEQIGTRQVVMGYDDGLNAFQINKGTAFAAFNAADLSIADTGEIYLGNLTGTPLTASDLTYAPTTGLLTYVTSDRRMKTKIREFEGSGIEVLRLLHLYTYKAKGSKAEQLGLIAQDVKEVLPDCVGEDREGMLFIDYKRLNWYIFKAVQELIEIV